MINIYETYSQNRFPNQVELKEAASNYAELMELLGYTFSQTYNSYLNCYNFKFSLIKINKLDTIEYFQSYRQRAYDFIAYYRNEKSITKKLIKKKL